MKKSVRYKGYIESIVDGVAFCVLYKDDSTYGIKYTAEVPVSEFKEKVKEGTFINCIEKDGLACNFKARRILKWTKKDADKAEKWAKELSKKIKWE